MYFLIVFIAFCTISPSLQSCPYNAKRQIEQCRQNAEQRMRDALGNKVDTSVLMIPLKELDELEAAGKEDVDEIKRCKMSKEMCSAIRKSLIFWRNQMEEVIRPYVEHPEVYQNMVIDFAFIPEDPTWNDTVAYKKIENELNYLSEEAIAKLEKEFIKQTEPGKCNKDVTEASWKKLQAKRALDSAVFSITFTRQLAKLEAANGQSTKKELVERLRQTIVSATDEFNGKLREIYC